MDIILNVMSRPLAGYDSEFEKLVDWIDTSRFSNPTSPHPYTIYKSTGFLGLGRKKEVFDIDAALARFHEISQHSGVTLNAPVVGRDAQADEWALEAFAKGWLNAKNAADAVTRYKGLYVFDLLPTCDGFPVYSPSSWDRGYDRTSLNGTVLDAFEEEIGTDLTEYLHGPILAGELAEWARKLRLWADNYAQTHQLETILGNRDFISDDDGGPETCLHIVDQTARWAAFWSARGHGAEPHFI